MMKRGRTIVVAAAALLGCATPAYALMYGPIGAPIPCPFDSGFTFLVVTCLQTAIEEATYRLLPQFTDIMWQPIMALITLQISIFGVFAAMGASEIHKKALALLLKIGVVLIFADNLGGFAPTIFGVMEEAQVLIIEAIGPLALPADCPVAGGGFFYSIVWVYMDCLLDKLFQFEQPMMIFNAVFALISAALFSGSVGVMVFFMGITMLLNVLGYVFYAVYIFILSYIYVGFLIVISPLLVPLLLVEVGAGAYQRWLFNVVAGIAIPVFVLAYLTLTLPVLEFSIFEASGSLEEVLGDDYTKWYRNEQQWCSQQIGTDRDNYKALAGTFGGFDYIAGPLRNILTPMMSGSTDYCATFGTSSLDFFEKHVPMLMQILDALIRILVTAYLLNALMKKMPMLASQIFGGGFSLGMAGQEGLPFQSALRGGMQEARTSMDTAAKGLGPGALFSKGLPGVKR